MNLKEVRISKGMSQKELADASGVKFRMLQNYEQGVRDIDGAKLGTLIDLAVALECKISDIVDQPELVNKCKKFGI